VKWLKEDVREAKDIKKAARLFSYGLLRRCLAGLRENVRLGTDKVVAQREQKRVVLRKIKIVVLKMKLAEAKSRRSKMSKVFAGWKRVECRMRAVAEGHWVECLLGKVFERWGIAERAGRRERWIAKLVGGGLAPVEEEEAGGGGADEEGMFSPSMKNKRKQAGYYTRR
jgi:hypothetical protein